MIRANSGSRPSSPPTKTLGAEVEIELSTGPYRFVYRKRWHKQRETVLDILEPGRAQLTGREAHDKVRAILDETLDEALWDAFRLKQGAKLEQAAFAGGSLGRALDKAAGGEATGDREDDLWERISAERDRYWTATGQVKGDRTALAAGSPTPRRRSLRWRPHSARWTTMPSAVDRLVDEAKVLRKDRRSRRRERTSSSRSSRRSKAAVNDVARLEGLHDTAVAQRDHLLGVSGIRAELRERVAETGGRGCRDGVAGRGARCPPAKRSWPGCPRCSRSSTP